MKSNVEDESGGALGHDSAVMCWGILTTGFLTHRTNNVYDGEARETREW